ncbi:MAG: ribosome-binding factor A [Flavobacteriaceae bacterium]|nr:ribosome-binding factor A [Flavobacteriaceae bacterium]|tara:strand:- start:52006 stop:52398 length:393 start_codon:yes stop_codon:yes gene_type:complete
MNSQSPRQRKVSTLIKKELAKMLQETLIKEGMKNILVSITKVSVTVDFAFAKIYLSIYPTGSALDYLALLNENKKKIKHAMAIRMKNQLRKMPDLSFFIDDSLDYIRNIESALKNSIDPIQNPDLTSGKK